MTSDRAPAKRPKAADVTPWFSWRQRPKRVGLYQVRERTGERWYCLWDAYDWHYGDNEATMPNPGNEIPQRWLGEFIHEWRGLRQPAAAPPPRKRR